MQKLKSVEMLRCVAAMLVVLFHTETIAGTRMAKPPFDGAFSGGSHGVDLFFVLSGFIISYVHHGDVGRPKRLANYAFNRASRIFPAVWIMTSLALALYAAGYGGAAKALTGRRLVWRLRDVLDETHFSASLIKIVVRLANWKASCVIANSEATKRAFGQAGGDLSRTFVAYPGIDERPFVEVTESEVAAMRAELGAGEVKLVGVFGRLFAWKGQDVFVEALARVPGAVGVIVGGALFGEEAFEAALREKIVALGVQDRIRLLGFREDIPLLMRAMDVVVHCSVAAEPFGRVVVEGMLAGKLVVASKAGGVMEIVEDGVTGFLVEPGCVGGLAGAVGAAIAGATVVAAAGHQLARVKYTIEATMRQIQMALSGLS